MLALNYFACFKEKICICDTVEDTIENEYFQGEPVHLC